MLETRQHARFWEEALQMPATRQARLLLLEAGTASFVHQSYIAIRRLTGYPEPQVVSPVLAIRHRFKILRGLNEDLAVALGEVHLQADHINKDSADSANSASFHAVGQATLKMRATVAQLAAHPMARAASDDEAQQPLFLMVDPSTIPQTKQKTSSPAAVPHLERRFVESEEVWNELAGLRTDIEQADLHTVRHLELYRSPTLAEQTWMRRCARLSVMSGLGFYLVCHSRLTGSPDLGRWIHGFTESVCTFVLERVVQPGKQISAELQRTFATNEDVNLLALEESRQILQRMLEDFDQRHGVERQSTAVVVFNIGELPEFSGTMARVLARFETEAKSPLRNLITGELSNLLVIQMQSIKLQTENALLQMDRILQANQINFAIMAAMPAVGTLWLLGALAHARFHSQSNHPERSRQMQQYMRCLLVEAERAIWQCGEVQDQGPLEVGLQIFSLNELYVATSQIRSCMSGLEWRNLRTDITDLAVPDLPLKRKLSILDRMLRSYSIFLPG
ncbi:unnamed protein product [Polarella glacialis]|uniref:Nuclear control of ATPase protein 2 n=1 Tax=Polarella glacialis TaxID=89957 RepID=A0A813HUI0_POLGL|nr:unnamed protein product [Polarella glacialis]